MTLDQLKTIPTSRNGKMLYGIFCAFLARELINTGVALMGSKNEGALMAFLGAGVMLYNVVLTVRRFNTERPLFDAAE